MYVFRRLSWDRESRVIEAIIEAFSQLNCVEQLLVCAMTGVAANLIGGSTVDSVANVHLAMAV